MNHPSWVALQGMAHGFIELDKAVVHVIDWLVLCNCCFQSVCPLLEKDKRLMEASWWEKLTEGETGSDGRAILSKSLIQFSLDGWGCIPSLLFTWGQTMVKVKKIVVTSLERPHAGNATLSAPNPAVGHHRPMPLLETPGHSWASLDQSLAGSLFLPLVSWCTQVLFLPSCVSSKSLFPQSCVSSSSSLMG